MDKGFTLMEVLVATAICGIALGVALAGLSQGHRAAQRAVVMQDAGRALKLALLEIASEERQGSIEEQGEIQGEIGGMKGWSYRVSSGELSIRLKEGANGTDGQEEEGDASIITIEDLRETTIDIIGPGGQRFSIVSWR